jgi:putative nucleotidyltransferase with HDIG domain
MDLEQLIKDIDELVSFPQVAIRVTRMVEDKMSSAEDLGRELAQDPALSLKLLRLANSPLYGARNEIDTISRAVMILGTMRIRDMVLASSAIDSFNGIPNELVTMEDFWRRSLYTGLASRFIAAQRGEWREESSFVAGLLHNIGKLVIYNRFPEQSVRTFMMVLDGEVVESFQAEKSILGFDHAELGGALLRKWNLPEHLVEAVAWHHEPEKAEKYPQEAALTHVSSRISLMAQLDTTVIEDVPPVSAASMERLGLSHKDLPAIVEQIQHAIVEVEEVLL